MLKHLLIGLRLREVFRNSLQRCSHMHVTELFDAQSNQLLKLYRGL